MRLCKKPLETFILSMEGIPLEIKLIQFSSHTSLSLTQASWSLYLYKLLRLSSVKAQLSHTHLLTSMVRERAPQAAA